jgi:hypothetical protein
MHSKAWCVDPWNHGNEVVFKYTETIQADDEICFSYSLIL